ncbi:bis(5'-nucleosyl)-tetraphosphatase (symmetrical) YqeK [Natronospora cellulosivora (SeqCode)]
MKEADLILDLKNKLSEKRFVHSLAVADTAEIIANIENCSVMKARQAGLLHDYAKLLSFNELKRISDLILDDWKIDNDELSIPHLLHAPVSAYLVERNLGINDREVLEAIRYHTIGSPDMGKLAQIIYVADYIEPNRNFKEADIIRKELENGLDSAIILICNYSIQYNIKKERIIHPNTLRLRNAYLRRRF